MGRKTLSTGRGYGKYTIPPATTVAEQGRAYDLGKDREALNELMQRRDSAGLKNIRREVPETLTDGNKHLETHRILYFSKA